MPSKSKQEWSDDTLEPSKQRFGERRERFETESGLEIDTVYTPEDADGFDYAGRLGYPGGHPGRGAQRLPSGCGAEPQRALEPASNGRGAHDA